MTFRQILEEHHAAAEYAARIQFLAKVREEILQAYAPEEELIATEITAFIAASGVQYKVHKSPTCSPTGALPIEHNDVLFRLSLVVELIGTHKRFLVLDSCGVTFTDRWSRLVDLVLTKTGWGRITWLGYQRPLDSSIVETAHWLLPVRVNYCGRKVLLRWRNANDTTKILQAMKALLEGKRPPASEFGDNDLNRPRLLGNRYFFH